MQQPFCVGEQALQMQFAFMSPPVKKGIPERPQTLRYPEIKNHSSAEYAHSERGAHSKSLSYTAAGLRKMAIARL